MKTKTSGPVMHRDVVKVTWSVLRGSALWPGWQEPEDGVGAAAPTVEVAGQIWAALAERGETVGWSFGCGTYLDGDGDEREAMSTVSGAQVVSYPGTLARDTGEVVALMEINSETRHGPNSFALGAELAWRFSGAHWAYAPDTVARIQVVRVETYAPQAGWVPLFVLGQPQALSVL